MSARQNAERAFGRTANFKESGDLSTRLRALLVDHVTMLETGTEITIAISSLQDALEARNLRSTRGKSHTARATLPLCERWGDQYGAHVPASARMALSDVLAHEARASLPTATRLCELGHRVGPGGIMRAELESAWAPLEHYGSIVRRCAPGRGGPPMDEPADAAALQQDGDRVWPPRALAAAECDGVAALVRKLCDALEAAPARARQTNGVGLYVRAVERVLTTNPADPADPADQAASGLLGLGVAVFARNPMALRSVRKRALHGAMAAHARGRAALGEQLERLGEAAHALLP